MVKRLRIHNIKAHNSYDHHIALYPDSFKGVVVREENVCIQFDPTTIKAIKNPTALKELPYKNGTYIMELSTNGTDVSTIGLRLTYPILFDMMLSVIHGYKDIDTLKLLYAEIHRAIVKLETE